MAKKINKEEEMVICQLSGKKVNENDATDGFSIREELMSIIQKKNPDFDVEGWVSNDELNKIKTERIKSLLQEDAGYLGEIEKKVAEAVDKHDFMSKDFTEEDDEEDLTLGQKLSDKVAEFGGSWKFIIIFSVICFGWIGMNVVIYENKGFDPYPFILLNLILSCVAALQAPIIMMSQNRMEEKDRARAINDFKVGLKTEIEISMIDEKINHLVNKQVFHIHETLELQNEMLENIIKNTRKRKYKRKLPVDNF